MRPLKLNPGHAVTALALAPDGAKLGVVQSTHGFRLFDSVGGGELGRDTKQTPVSESSPTGRHMLWADRAAVRLAEVTAGKPFLRFQTGWTPADGRNRPPAESVTLALHSGVRVGALNGFDRRGRQASPLSSWAVLNDCALTADHRFVVGRDPHSTFRCLVCDLATEALVADGLDMTASRNGYEPVRFVFTPCETRLVACTPRVLLVYELSPSGALLPPALSPTVVIRMTQPQPGPEAVPFALLPCGSKVLLRGERSRVELRDLATGAVLTEWRWGLPKLNALAVAGDGLTAAAGGTSGLVVLWDLD